MEIYTSMLRLFLSVCLIILFLFQIKHVKADGLKVVLAANTADLAQPDDLFDIIRTHLVHSSSSDTVIWVLNGDIFPENYAGETIKTWKIQANSLLESYPNLFIILNQGDRDWLNSSKEGWKNVASLQVLLSQREHPRFKHFLKHGCPGPWVESFPNLEVVVINSQWWNHPFEKPSPTSNICRVADSDNFFEELGGILEEAKTRNILLLSHFPLVSLGNYGGRFPASAYLFPPRVAFRQNVGYSTDISNKQFESVRYRLAGLLHDYPSVVFASGHEMNHSIIKPESNFYVNSGALAAGGFVAKSKNVLLRSSALGFVELAYSVDGRVGFNNYTLSNGMLSVVKTGELFTAPFKQQLDEWPETARIDRSVETVVAGGEYRSNWFKRMWLGQHYRSSWTTPVSVPYLNLDTTNSGLTFTGRGGGRQTTSLKISAGNGKEYVFRSVDKDPFRALDFSLRGTVVADILKDQTSTQQPYGAMAVAPLLDKIGVLHATPELFVLPSDNRLAKYRTCCADLFGMLEERPSDKVAEGNVFGGAVNIEKSFKVFGKLYNDYNNTIDSKEYARARVFDIWIGDWSKHEDNWKWAGFAEYGGKIYRPIPRDRDHAFSRWDGILPWIADREWAVPNGENFGERIHGLRSLMWQARHLDRFVGSRLTKQDWIAAAGRITESITDSDIENAIRRMPPEIYETDGKEIERKLKVRMKGLKSYAGKYYDLLAKSVDVVGSNKSDFFQVVRNIDSSVDVTITGFSDSVSHNPSKVFYHRKFIASETKEIRLYGLRGDDVFAITGKAQKSILTRVVSGEGNKVVTDESTVAGKRHMTLLYDASVNTKITKGTELKNVKSKNTEVYEYNRSSFAYNTYMPVALVTYNPFVGIALHAGVTFTRHNFSKPEFSAKHTFRAALSFRGDYDLNYDNEIRQVAGRWDFISGIGISRPLDYNYFFGVGNDTENDETRSSEYYRAEYNSLDAHVGLGRTFWKKSRAEFTLNYEINEGLIRPDTYLSDNSDIFGLGKLNLVFVKGLLSIDLRDRFALPERGFLFEVNQELGAASASTKKVFSISEFEIQQFISTYSKNPLTLGLRAGGGVNAGHTPFYKMLSIGELNDLRGYKRNRFSGSAKAFMNTELRYQLIETKNTFVPLKIGVRGFFDVGQIWNDGEKRQARNWHRGYGGGVYIVPFKEQFAFNATIGRSKEESLLLMISVGSFFR